MICLYFLGLFKREALNVDPQELIPILQEINKIVKFKKYGSIASKFRWWTWSF